MGKRGINDGVCSIDGCKNHAYRKGFCLKHYDEQRLKEKVCKIEGCDKKVYARGLCSKHYKNRFTGKICLVENCNNPAIAKGLCNRHYCQIKQYGKIFKTKSDPNEIIIDGDYAYIVLCNNKKEEVAKAKIDVEDVEFVKAYKWCLDRRYVLTKSVNGKRQYLHRFICEINGILQAEDERIVDHKNRNPLDNTKENLRAATFSQNAMNRKIRSNNKSGKQGVHWAENCKKWHAEITVNAKVINLGLFKNFEDAVAAREAAEKKYFGKFKPNN